MSDGGTYAVTGFYGVDVLDGALRVQTCECTNCGCPSCGGSVEESINLLGTDMQDDETYSGIQE